MKRNITRERGIDVYGLPTASAAKPDARASTSCHQGDRIPGKENDKQEEGAGRRYTIGENPPEGMEKRDENERELGCRNRKRSRDNIDKADTNPAQQSGNQDEEREGSVSYRREAERLYIYGRAFLETFVTTTI